MQALNNDQRRETVNTRQRFEALREARRRLFDYRGSMVWSQSKGAEYLLRSSDDTASAGNAPTVSLTPREELLYDSLS